MKLTSLKIDGFGMWSDLELEGLDEPLSVFYGRNEAGKTTLLQFIRSILYGFSPQRRQRYFPPLHGGQPGGMLQVTSPNGSFCVSRHQNDDTHPEGDVLLTAADGTQQGGHLLGVLLCNVDEAVFNNVFAVGLREIQELGTLSDTDAARLLYDLTSGLDRVSLLEVTRALESSRCRLLAPDDRPSVVTDLLAEQEQLQGEIEELGTLSRRYGRLSADLGQLRGKAERLQETIDELEMQAGVIDVATAVGPKWHESTALGGQIEALGPIDGLSTDAVHRLESINAKIAGRQSRRRELRDRRRELRDEAERLNFNEPLWRNGPRIEALVEQRGWIESIRQDVDKLQSEVEQLQQQRRAEYERLGLTPDDASADRTSAPQVTPRTLAALRAPVRALREARHERTHAQQQVAAAAEALQTLEAEVRRAMASRPHGDLTSALETAGNRVAQLRRRVQLDERLLQLSGHQKKLQQRSDRLMERQMLSLPALAGLGVLFVVGMVLLLCGVVGMILPSLGLAGGWLVAAFGILLCGGAGLAKPVLERTAATRLETCQKQATMLELQVKQAEQDRDKLDEQLPHGSGPLASRLKDAEEQLAKLEALLPLQARRQIAEDELLAAEERQEASDATYRRHVGHWRSALREAGLPAGLSPKQVRNLANNDARLETIERDLERRDEELAQRRGQWESIVGRVNQLAADVGLQDVVGDPATCLERLRETLGQQEALVLRRQQLRDQSRRCRQDQKKYARAVQSLQMRRRRLLHEAGTDSEAEFLRRAELQQQAETLQQRRAQLEAEIEAAIAGRCSRGRLAECLEGDADAALIERREQIAARLEKSRAELLQETEKRGALSHELETLVDDRQWTEKQLQLGCVQRRLQDAIEQWQVQATTAHVLDVVRHRYEQERQPETLQEASGYLDRLTEGRYRRVWTPLGEETLLVDDAEGNVLRVEVLSRGTREQLFLSLRLALVASYARRGAQLPLVLDDVLVNFDVPRAKAAARVLRDFAKAGHHLLVFTCHEHIKKIFTAMRVKVRELPDHQPSVDEVPALAEAEKEEAAPAKRRRRAAKKQPVEVVEEIDEPMEEEEKLIETAAEDEEEEIELSDEDFEDEEEEDEELDEDEEDDEEYEEEDDESQAA